MASMEENTDVLKFVLQSFEHLPQSLIATLKSLEYDTGLPYPGDVDPKQFVEAMLRSLEPKFDTHVQVRRTSTHNEGYANSGNTSLMLGWKSTPNEGYANSRDTSSILRRTSTHNGRYADSRNTSSILRRMSTHSEGYTNSRDTSLTLRRTLTHNEGYAHSRDTSSTLRRTSTHHEGYATRDVSSIRDFHVQRTSTHNEGYSNFQDTSSIPNLRVLRTSTYNKGCSHVPSTSLVPGFHVQKTSTYSEGYRYPHLLNTTAIPDSNVQRTSIAAYNKGSAFGSESHTELPCPEKLLRLLETSLSFQKDESYTEPLQYLRAALNQTASKHNNDASNDEGSRGRRRKCGGFGVEACFTVATAALLVAPFDHSGVSLILAIIAIAGGLLRLTYQCSKKSKIVECFNRAVEELKRKIRKRKYKGRIKMEH